MKMSTILVTGASGFIGKAMAKDLAAAGHSVVCMSRKKPELDGVKFEFVGGSFESFEDLRGLDKHKIDSVVHLAAVTGGCSEEDGLAVNVQGTRRLMRYLLDRGTRKFVLASSIAATGCLTGNEPRFVPLTLPMRPDHPCIGRDAYGLSKALMEEVAKQYARSAADIDVVSLRFGAVIDESNYNKWLPAMAEFPAWAVVILGRVALSDVLRGVNAALASAKPGFRSFNLVGPDCSMEEPVTALRKVFGDRGKHLDYSAYERAGHEHDAIWSMDEIKAGLGFTPRIPTRPSAFDAWKGNQK